MKDRFGNTLQQDFLEYLKLSIDVFGGAFDKYFMPKRPGFGFMKAQKCQNLETSKISPNIKIWVPKMILSAASTSPHALQPVRRRGPAETLSFDKMMYTLKPFACV